MQTSWFRGTIQVSVSSSNSSDKEITSVGGIGKIFGEKLKM